MSSLNLNILTVCQNAGMRFKKQGTEFYAPCPFHADGKRPNFRVSAEKGTWFCDVCNEGGGPVEFIAKKEGRDKKEVFKELVKKNDSSNIDPLGEIVATYDYTDAFGNLLYQVCRYQPKTFRQRRPDGKGGWIWGMEGVERVLYHLTDILKPAAKMVWIVEGEKDVETLRSIGMTATCNVCGAGKWCEAYSEVFQDKDEVILCGDNDAAGRKHMKEVAESVGLKAKAVRVVTLPDKFKDISDFAASFNNRQQFVDALEPITMNSPVMVRGSTLPIKSMADLEAEYIEDVKNQRTRLVKLSRWLPSLGCVRPLVAGELVSIIGDTGIGKTYVLQHIALHAGVPTLLFELELPGSLTFERFVAIARDKHAYEVFNTYDQDKRVEYSDMRDIYTCTKSRLTPEEIEGLILKAELRMGARPTLVLIDYIQLIHTFGKSRYEQISSAVEHLKAVAKNTGTVIILASQVKRERHSDEITLHDAKESGSIENSSGVVIGIWKDADAGRKIIKLRVLKNTKGIPSTLITCNIADSMRITEREASADKPEQPKAKYKRGLPYCDDDSASPGT